MASTAETGSSSQNGLTPAQRLQQAHEATDAHQPTIEDIPDEEDIAHPAPSASVPKPLVDPDISMINGGAMSAKAIGKQRANDGSVSNVSEQQVKNKTPAVAIDTTSDEAFPALGPARAAPVASTWGSRPAGARTNGVLNNATPAYSPARAPASIGQRPSHGVSIPGRYTEDMRMPSDQMRTDLKRPIADLLKDINRKSKATVDMKRSAGHIIFQGQGPNVESVHEILREVAAQLGQKQQIKVPVPVSLRAHIIGKQGSTIQAISRRTGARVQMPKPAGEEDEDDTVDVEIEGSPMAVAMAKHEIETIINQRTSTVNLKLKDIAAELFPFLAGPHNSRVNALEEGRDVRVKIPQYHTFQQSAPTVNSLSQFAPQQGYDIHIAGEREAAKQVQAEIQRRVQELQSQLSVSQVPIEQSRHQFIVGNRGNSLHDFLQETGCSIVLPPSSEDSEMITIIGPQHQIDRATDRAMDLASSMHMQKVDFGKQFPGSREHAEMHAQDLGRYFRKRRALQQYEKQHDAQVVPEGSSQWQIFSRDPRSAMRARNDVLNLVSGHPPARFRNVNVPPFYQRNLQQQHAQPLRDQHGVFLMTPEDPESERVILVFEGPTGGEDYAFPSKQPTAEETSEFERQLQEAEAYLLGLIGEQQSIENRSIDAPSKYREKLQRRVGRMGQQDTDNMYPVEFLGLDGPSSSAGQSFPLRFRGPASAVDDYEQKLRAFIEEQINDEAERGYTLNFDFPQKFANVLIGRKGENINKLRDEFDVDIQVNDGQVELKGPQAKANAAKSHIMSMARKLEDETTHVLKIAPKFHRELIGAKGSQVLRLQDRYNVRVQFPRSANDTPDDASDAGGAKRKAQAPDEVVIKGPKKGADEARDELWNLYTYIQDVSHTATISVSQSQVPSLIGQGGRELQSLREATGAEIDIPGKDTVDSNGRVEIKLKGKKANVENARKLIQERVKIFDESVSRSIDIDRKHHRALIGRDGDNIRQIVLQAGGSGDSRELNRMVQIPKADSSNNDIRVEGPPSIVESIIAAIQKFALDRDSQITETVEVPPGRHGAIIGRGGETRKAIESEHNITMQIPATTVTGPARSQIKLSGAPEDVAKAKERIQSMTKESEGVTIDMPHHLHHAVADTNGNIFQQLRRDLRVNIDHAGQQKPSRPAPPAKTKQAAQANMPLITDDTSSSSAAGADPQKDHTFDIIDAAPAATSNETIPWILRGPDSSAIQRAREQIEAAMAAAQEGVTGYLVLPDPKTYRYVIGQGGSTVNMIRRETGARIDVPKAGAGAGGAIEIGGTRSQVEAAKEMILGAVVQGMEGGGGGRRERERYD